MGGVAVVSNKVTNDQDSLTPLHAAIDDITGAGDNAVIAAVSGKKIRVIAYAIGVDGATTVTWKNGTTAVTGPMDLAANAQLVAGWNPSGWFETAAGAALNMTLGSTSQKVSGHITYVLV